MHPCFAKHGNLRIFIRKGFITTVHKIKIIVRISIYPPSINSKFFHCPYRMLN